MIGLNLDKYPSRYEVQVGYSRVNVKGRCRIEAIRLARIKLSQELPRLYDVIHGLADERFHVKAID